MVKSCRPSEKPPIPRIRHRRSVTPRRNWAPAIRSLNPSYAIAPVIGNSSASGGSYYIRSNAYPYQYSNAYGTTTWLAAPPLGLPPPVYL